MADEVLSKLSSTQQPWTIHDMGEWNAPTATRTGRWVDDGVQESQGTPIGLLSAKYVGVVHDKHHVARGGRNRDTPFDMGLHLVRHRPHRAIRANELACDANPTTSLRWTCTGLRKLADGGSSGYSTPSHPISGSAAQTSVSMPQDAKDAKVRDHRLHLPQAARSSGGVSA